ncbi:unnamed protein product [Umbelopsis vinacea]
MPPTLRIRKNQKETSYDSNSTPASSSTKSKRDPEAKEHKPRKRVKNEVAENVIETKENTDASDEKKPKAKKTARAKATPDQMNNKLKNTEYRCWLMKAEPDTRIVKDKDVKFSIDDLKAMPNSTSQWDGVRNFEARNIMRDSMKIGHQVLFYHSNCKQPGIAGIAEIVREGYIDYTAFDESHPYFDPKSDKSNPKWYMVDVKFVRKLKRLIPLKELQSCKDLSEMMLIKRGRLSVQPVTDDEYNFILSLEDNKNETE